MRFRLTSPVIAIGALFVAVALGGAPLFAAEATQGTGASRSAGSEQYSDTSVQVAAPALARLDQRDTAPERAAKHRLVLVAILTALVAAPLVLHTSRSRDTLRQPPWPAAASPFSGRAPPRLTAHCA